MKQFPKNALCEFWNSRYGIGTEVTYKEIVTYTISEAFLVSPRCPVILLKKICGMVLLEDVIVLEEIYERY